MSAREARRPGRDRALPRPAAVRRRPTRSSRSAKGSTPLVLAERLSERVGAEVHLKLEGTNPTGSFKDRGMTCAVSAAVREGAKAVICASTGNTAASAAAYAAKAGLRGAVIVPDGKIATGKLAQALVHGARVIALRGNFDTALELVRELADRHPIALVNSVNEFRLQGQKTASFELLEDLDGRIDALCIPVGNAGNITAYWQGLRRGGRGAAAVRLPGRGGRAARHRPAPVERPGDDRERDPDRQPGSLGGGDRRDARLARRDPRRHRRGDPRRLPAARRERGRLLRAGVGGLGRGAPEVRRRRRGARSPACSPGTGSRTPTSRSSRSGAVVPCEPQLRAIERARPRMTHDRYASACPPPRPTSARASTASPRRSACSSSSRSSDGDRFEVATDLDVPLRPLEPGVAAFERVHPADGLRFEIALEIPLSGGLGSSAAAVVAGLLAARTAPARRLDVLALATSSRAIPTTSPPRCTAAWSSSARRRRRTASTAPADSRRVLVVPHEAVATARRPRGAARLRCRSPTPSTTPRTARCWCSVSQDADPALVARGLRDRLHQPYRAHLYPRSAELAREARARSARSARRSPAPARRCSSGSRPISKHRSPNS